MRMKREDIPEEIKQSIEQIGARIADLRKSKMISREKFAYGIGLAKSYMGYIEKGTANPTLETLYLIAHGLEVSLLELLDIDHFLKK